MANVPPPPRVLVLGAHPDDAEVFAGGLVVRHCRQKAVVKIVSVTDGRSGHQSMATDALIAVRRQEASRAGELVGAEYVTWDFPDGRLTPNLDVRETIIKEIRQFSPDLILTHRTNDYHPDHRAVGVAVQDASYMVTVPAVCPEVPALRSDPVVAFMSDLFTRPNPMRTDVILDMSLEFDENVRMAACHQSQFFEWLAFHDGVLDQVPASEEEKLAWLSTRFAEMHASRRSHFRQHGQLPVNLELPDKLEVYEISEYACQPDSDMFARLFPSVIHSDYLSRSQT